MSETPESSSIKISKISSLDRSLLDSDHCSNWSHRLLSIPAPITSLRGAQLNIQLELNRTQNYVNLTLGWILLDIVLVIISDRYNFLLLFYCVSGTSHTGCKGIVHSVWPTLHRPLSIIYLELFPDSHRISYVTLVMAMYSFRPLAWLAMAQLLLSTVTHIMYPY